MDQRPAATRRVGIRDVAAAAGVSPTTVSHALSGARAIKPETRARVLREVERLGYSPDPQARGLRHARTYTIGFLSDVIASTPHAGEVISGAQEVASEHGSVLMVLDSQGDPANEALQIRTLLSHRVDGFVYARMSHQAVEVPEALSGARVVLANASTIRPDVSWVVPDEHGIGLTATQHLLDHGHRRIAFCTIADAVPAAVGRERGYRDRLTAAGVAVDETLIVRASGNAPGGRVSVGALFDRVDRPTGVFCFNDEIAMGVYQAAAQRGLAIPDDVSVVGVDDLRIIAEALTPGLTTVALPHNAMGRWAAAHLMEAIDGTPEPVGEKLACTLIERGSVARAR